MYGRGILRVITNSTDARFFQAYLLLHANTRCEMGCPLPLSHNFLTPTSAQRRLLTNFHFPSPFPFGRRCYASFFSCCSPTQPSEYPVLPNPRCPSSPILIVHPHFFSPVFVLPSPLPWLIHKIGSRGKFWWWERALCSWVCVVYPEHRSLCSSVFFTTLRHLFFWNYALSL